MTNQASRRTVQRQKRSEREADERQQADLLDPKTADTALDDLVKKSIKDHGA